MQAARVHGVPMRNLVADWNKWSRAESVLAVMGALLLIAVPLRLLMVDRPERRDLHYPTPDQFPKLRSQPLTGGDPLFCSDGAATPRAPGINAPCAGAEGCDVQETAG